MCTYKNFIINQRIIKYYYYTYKYKDKKNKLTRVIFNCCFNSLFLYKFKKFLTRILVLIFIVSLLSFY